MVVNNEEVGHMCESFQLLIFARIARNVLLSRWQQSSREYAVSFSLNLRCLTPDGTMATSNLPDLPCFLFWSNLKLIRSYPAGFIDK